MIEAFAQVDADLTEAAGSDPKVLNDDAHLESLLRKQAQTLHVGPANAERAAADQRQCFLQIGQPVRCPGQAAFGEL
ncbi:MULTISPECIES: hypothetical protein [unclassified Streptomyces]|uniref:hypothetical protein n=1 Tax=unclassified Streptomyces TaxID=2593676 RepID=UPI0033B88062